MLDSKSAVMTRTGLTGRKILTLVSVVIGSSVILTASPPRSCAEIGKPPTLDDFKRDATLRNEALKEIRGTQAIFIGEAVASSETSATFKVTRVWHGDLITLLTLRGPVQLRPDGTRVWTSEIASDFKIGASYLVYAIGPSLADAWPLSCSTALVSKSRTTIQILDFLVKARLPKRSSF